MKNKIKDSFLFTSPSDLCEMGPCKFTKTIIKTGIFIAASYGVGILIVEGFKYVKNKLSIIQTDDDFDDEFPDVTKVVADSIKHTLNEGCQESIKNQGLSDVAKDMTNE